MIRFYSLRIGENHEKNIFDFDYDYDFDDVAFDKQL